ncbi:hypothetical protein [Alkaliphilus hydrothermalis]|uniref:Uncharacterized protein n=1 Tax=Alkaliphilus hydrothermalis TaxID=1482730 RepID=A0ABS2NSC4_9FIRM|nr:hypothetical protein [Alkaliphilus hydrothermalis]MBM7615858.1 hypothetical protein [Alkaliphilus hydrothermalis]
MVEDQCIFITPRIWREGALSDAKAWEAISRLAERNGIRLEPWKSCDLISGFKEMTVYPLNKSLKARGWLLWLSGVFNSAPISFWDTLTDRWKESPYFQLPEIEFELEIVVAKK